MKKSRTDYATLNTSIALAIQPFQALIGFVSRKIFLNILPLVICAVTFVCAYILHKSFANIFMQYHQNDEAYKKALKSIKKYQSLLILTPVVCAVAISYLFVFIRAPEYYRTDVFTAILLFSLGSSFFFALFFYVFFIYSHLEKRIFIMKIHFKAASKTCGKSTALLC